MFVIISLVAVMVVRLAAAGVLTKLLDEIINQGFENAVVLPIILLIRVIMSLFKLLNLLNETMAPEISVIMLA